MSIHYSDLLKKELLERTKQNNSYSLRAFARDLSMTPSQVSSVLSKKKNISLARAYQIAEQIYETKSEREHFINLVDFATTKNEKQKDKAHQKILKIIEKQNSTYALIELDKFHYISNWYYLAVLDLTSLESFKPDPRWISTYLGITEMQARDAIERLLRLGLLIETNGIFKKSSKSIQTQNEIPSKVLRDYHKQMIQKSIDSLDTQTIKQRYTIGQTMALRRSDIEKLKRTIDDMLDELSFQAKSSKGTDALYQVNVQLFDLKKSKKA